jgi:hypothetical protein
VEIAVVEKTVVVETERILISHSTTIKGVNKIDTFLLVYSCKILTERSKEGLFSALIMVFAVYRSVVSQGRTNNHIGSFFYIVQSFFCSDFL